MLFSLGKKFALINSLKKKEPIVADYPIVTHSGCKEFLWIFQGLPSPQTFKTPSICQCFLMKHILKLVDMSLNKIVILCKCYE